MVTHKREGEQWQIVFCDCFVKEYKKLFAFSLVVENFFLVHAPCKDMIDFSLHNHSPHLLQTYTNNMENPHLKEDFIGLCWTLGW